MIWFPPCPVKRGCTILDNGKMLEQEAKTWPVRQQNRDGFFTCCTCDCSVQETETRLNNHTKELSNKTPSTVNTSRLSSTMMGITTFCFSCPCILLRLEFTKNNEQHKFSPSQLMAELHRIKTDKTGHCQNHTGALCYCFRPHNI